MLPATVEHRIRAAYGGRRGFARHLYYRALYLPAVPARRRDWSKVHRLIFVCDGNICRSAYAEAKARSMGLNALSFGCRTDGGVGANEVAIRVSTRRGIDLTSHVTRGPLDISLAADDLVLCFEPRQAREVARVARPAGAPTSLIGLWSSPRRPYVHDPYGAEEAYFETCFDIVDSALVNLSARLVPLFAQARMGAGSTDAPRSGL